MPSRIANNARRRPNVTKRLVCSECLKKQEEIYRLREQVRSLQGQLRRQQRTINEGYFGLSTPSSKKLFKVNASGEKKNGGARLGHPGHGRRGIPEDEVNVIREIDTAQPLCPDCGVVLDDIESRSRQVIDVVPLTVKKIVYKLHRRRCPKCRRTFRAQAPGVLPKFQYGNTLLATVATEHYLEGTPLSRLAKRLKVSIGSLFGAMHHLAKLLEPISPELITAYRHAPVKHADETTWRNDGQNGFAWLFATPEVSLFRLRPTRSAEVTREVLGEKPLPGVLVVDRYHVYNRAPVKLQYCYAHLLRDVQDLGKAFPTHTEVHNFVEITASLLADAIKLRALPISNRMFYRRARELREKIQEVMNQPAGHAGIRKIQDIFRNHPTRLYHWAQDRAVPADNNFAKRELRPLVIARKISFGSQSEAGAHTREILMSLLLTLSKRIPRSEIIPQLQACLDRLASNPDQDPYPLLFALDSS